jgi:hypothetical protein
MMDDAITKGGGCDGARFVLVDGEKSIASRLIAAVA